MNATVVGTAWSPDPRKIDALAADRRLPESGAEVQVLLTDFDGQMCQVRGAGTTDLVGRFEVNADLPSDVEMLQARTWGLIPGVFVTVATLDGRKSMSCGVLLPDWWSNQRPFEVELPVGVLSAASLSAGAGSLLADSRMVSSFDLPVGQVAMVQPGFNSEYASFADQGLAAGPRVDALIAPTTVVSMLGESTTRFQQALAEQRGPTGGSISGTKFLDTVAAIADGFKP